MSLHSVPIILSIDGQIRDTIFSIVVLLYTYLYIMLYILHMCVYCGACCKYSWGRLCRELIIKLDLEEEEQSNSDKTERASEWRTSLCGSAEACNPVACIALSGLRGWQWGWVEGSYKGLPGNQVTEACILKSGLDLMEDGKPVNASNLGRQLILYIE